MQFQALAIDYDGTLALDGHVDELVVSALERLSASGRKLILVTGRQLDDFFDIFPAFTIFDRIVAENGALLYRPKTGESHLLCPPASTALIDTLKRKAIAPLAVGRGIVATVEPNETVVLQTIRDLGLELHVIFNKGAVMILPAGVTKASGLKAALEELGIPAQAVAAAGDAENDHALLQSAGFGAAICDAVPALREAADYVTTGGAGEGAIELIEEILRDDLQTLVGRSVRLHGRFLLERAPVSTETS